MRRVKEENVGGKSGGEYYRVSRGRLHLPGHAKASARSHFTKPHWPKNPFLSNAFVNDYTSLI